MLRTRKRRTWSLPHLMLKCILVFCIYIRLEVRDILTSNFSFYHFVFPFYEKNTDTIKLDAHQCLFKSIHVKDYSKRRLNFSYYVSWKTLQYRVKNDRNYYVLWKTFQYRVKNDRNT